MNDNIYDVLETCLHEIENGAEINSVLARYPDLARRSVVVSSLRNVDVS